MSPRVVEIHGRDKGCEMRQSQGESKGQRSLAHSEDVASDRSNEETEPARVWGPLAPPMACSWKYQTLSSRKQRPQIYDELSSCKASNSFKVCSLFIPIIHLLFHIPSIHSVPTACWG